jgi:hypothetical protein
MAFKEDITSDTVAPPWLQKGANGGDGIGGRYLQAMGMELDTIGGPKGRSHDASVLHMPGLGDASGVPYIGYDRLLYQGPLTSYAAFVAMLVSAYDIWQRAGNDWTVLQIALMYAPGPSFPWLATIPARIATDFSAWSYYAPSDDTRRPPTQVSSLGNWTWDDSRKEDTRVSSIIWWRIWLILISAAPNVWVAQAPVLGTGGVPVLGSDPNRSLGFATKGPQFWDGLRQALAPVLAAGAWLRWIIISFDSAHYLVDSPAAGGINPDGDFGFGYKIVAGVYVANRFGSSCYVPGYPVPT